MARRLGRLVNSDLLAESIPGTALFSYLGQQQLVDVYGAREIESGGGFDLHGQRGLEPRVRC